MPGPIQIADLNNAKTDVDHIADIANSEALTATDRLGRTKRTLAGIDAEAETRMDAIDTAASEQREDIQDAADVVLAGIGYAPPVAYTAGLDMTTQTQTVSYDGAVYAPIQSDLPFTTSGVFETAKFRLLQGVSGADLAAPSGAGLVGCIHDFSGAVARTAQDKGRDWVSAFDSMTAAEIAAVKGGTSTADLTAHIEAAIATGKSVYLPGGTWKFNIEIPRKIVIFGDGSTKTIVKPYDDAVAAMTYLASSLDSPTTRDWTYHTEVRNIGFNSNSAKTGIGFALGRSDSADYVAGDEYANNVRFYGCVFDGLDKGIYFPFGSIGAEWYSCGWKACRYGIYTLNNKFGSPGTMHSGNKYVFGGQGDTCDVWLYVDNGTLDHGGGIVVNQTILQSNKIDFYCNSAQNSAPVVFSGCWKEGAGAIIGGTVDIDSWSGAVSTPQTVDCVTMLLDGENYRVIMRDCGTLGDVRIRGEGIGLIAKTSRVEVNPSYGGGTVTIDNPTDSYFLVEDAYTDGGVGKIDGMIVRGVPYQQSSAMAAGTPPRNRPFFAAPRSGIVKGAASRAYSHSMAGSTRLSGSFSLPGTVVADGRIYPACNEYTRAAFAVGEYVSLLEPVTSQIATTAGWYVATFDMKVISGSVQAHIWNRGTDVMAENMECPTAGRWYTFGVIAKAAGGEALFLDFGGKGADATWRVSAYQIHRFDTFAEASAFLESGQFCAEAAVETVASAAAIVLPYEGEMVNISGTTNITSIGVVGQAGKRKTLKFADALTFTDGSNLKLAGNFVTTADDTITLVCDGTNWYEAARSVN